jgi:hypothetical protein
VPLETPFRDIVGFINRSLLSSDLRTYQRLTAMRRHLIDALREEDPKRVVVERLAKMLDAGVLVLGADGRVELCSGPVPESGALWRRIAEHEDLLHEFEEDGWHTVAAPILPAPAGRPARLARDHEPPARARGPARGARGERTVALLQGVAAHALLGALPGDADIGVGRAFEAMSDVPVSFRDAELALERVAYEPGRRPLAAAADHGRRPRAGADGESARRVETAH